MKILLSSKLHFLILFNLSVLFFATTSIKADVLVIAYMDESKVAVVNGKTYKTIITLDSGKNPHEVRVSHDKRRAYVAAGKTITVVDLKNRKIKANFDLGEYSAHDIRVSRDNRRIWLACAGKETILELDAETGIVLNTYNIRQQGAWFLEVTPDERKFYTSNLEGKSVSVITRATGETKIIPFDHPVYGIDITPDGKQVWVTGRDLKVIDTTTDQIIHTIKTPEPGTGRLRLTSDGKKAVVGLSKKVVVYNVKTHSLLNEIEIGGDPKVMTLSSDNRRAFLTNPNANSVSVVNIISGKKLAEFQTGKKPDGIGWM